MAVSKSSSVKVNLTPELHARLRAVSAELGQAPATVASMAISTYVAQQARALGASERMVEEVGKFIGEQVGDQLKLLEPAKPKPRPRKKVAP